MQIVAGIDVGSGSTKCVLLDEGMRVVGRACVRTMPDFDQTARNALERASGGRPPQYVATTGLGRYSMQSRQIQITDITCAARGARRFEPDASFVLDIGAQCTRAIKMDDRGKVREFRTNEKCAAGSGGFLERAARYLEVTVDELGAMSLEAREPAQISSVCAVLAESEIINHVSEGRAVADIVRGIHRSLAERALMLLRRVGVSGKVVLVGGVALQGGMVVACREKFELDVVVPPEPQYVAATGAALLGWQRLARLSVPTATVA